MRRWTKAQNFTISIEIPVESTPSYIFQRIIYNPTMLKTDALETLSNIQNSRYDLYNPISWGLCLAFKLVDCCL